MMRSRSGALLTALVLSAAVGALSQPAQAQTGQGQTDAGQQASAEPAWVAAVRAAFEAGDQSRALALLQAQAERGDALAQASLGEVYLTGQLVAQDLAAAARWYRLASDQGLADAQNALARMIATGVAPASSPDEAMTLFAAAAQQGLAVHVHDYASALEARGGEGDIEAASAQYLLAAQAGYGPAQTSLGVLYLEGRGVETSLENALALFSAAAQAGDMRGTNNLGLLYARGQGVEQDYERAAELFQRAADGGSSEAMFNLASLYANAFGVALDEPRSEQLYRDAAQAAGNRFEALLGEARWSARLAPLDPSAEAAGRDLIAARAGDPVAIFAMAFRAQEGLGRPVSLREAARLYRESADQGLSIAKFNLGLLYARGSGVPQDFVRAYGLLNSAAAAGETDAAEVRDALLERMSETQRNQVLSTY